MTTNTKFGKKLSFYGIFNYYDRIEIPIIQRDYAQGRTGKREREVRKGILKHLITSIVNNKPAELDFIYGVERKYINIQGEKKVALIPIDGQQRLTTLWLIHWYLASKAELSDDKRNIIMSMLARFTYETRSSSKDFMEALCHEKIDLNGNIKEEVINNAPWFNESWLLDPTVCGCLNMLVDISSHPLIKDVDYNDLLKRLLDDNAPITFYFLSLENFGMGEEIYTRMNARGKILTDFEVFKSNFFNILDSSELKEQVTDKLEYGWVEILWPYREKNMYVTDTPFMNWLRYITQMIVVSNRIRRNSSDANEDYLDFEVLKDVYSIENNLKFLIHSLDSIPLLDRLDLNCSLNWDNKKGMSPAVKWILTNDITNTNVMYQLSVFAALKYLEKIPNGDGMENFIRVIRNLIENTSDKSIREWPDMIKTIEGLISTNVYEVLRSNGLTLKGFRSEQCEIEIFKGHLISFKPEALTLIKQMDDDELIQAREGNLILQLMEPKATDKYTLTLQDVNPENLPLDKLETFYKAYVETAKFDHCNYFDGVWGEFLLTPLYTNNDSVCYWNPGNNGYVDFANHPIILRLVRMVMENGLDVAITLLALQKKHIRKMLNRTEGDLSKLIAPKEQLYVLYLCTIRLLEKKWSDFFVCDRFNFGWVDIEKGYTSPFNHLLAENRSAKIYQTYPERFRSDTGIVEYRTPYVMRANVRGQKILERLKEWAETD